MTSIFPNVDSHAANKPVSSTPKYASRSEMLAARHQEILSAEHVRFGDGSARARDARLRAKPPQPTVYALPRAETPQQALDVSWRNRFHPTTVFRDPDTVSRPLGTPLTAADIVSKPLKEIREDHPRFHVSAATGALLPPSNVKPNCLNQSKYLHLRSKVEPRPKSGTLEPLAPLYSSFSTDFQYPQDAARQGGIGSFFTVSFGPPRSGAGTLVTPAPMTLSRQLIR